MPMTQAGMPKAVLHVWPMELDWTMQPMKPSARVMAMAKKHSQERAEAVVKRPLDVVDRAAGDGAVLVDDAGLLGQHGLCIDGGHAEEGDDPHPEDGAGAAD